MATAEAAKIIMMMSRKNERNVIMVDEEQHQRKKIFKKMDDHRAYLPKELIVDNILIRLPARVLAAFSCVSKLWYDFISSNDTRFAAAHFLEHKNEYNLVFNLFNVRKNNWEEAYFFNIQENSTKGEDAFLDCKLLMGLSLKIATELVGYCNGLACVKAVSQYGDGMGVVKVINPNRGETLSLPYCYFTPSGGCRHLCHGFGFDSLSQVYKAVVIHTSKDNDEFVCLVITLGTKSWRTIVTSVAKMSSPPGYKPFPKRMVTRPLRDFQREATLCGGNLFWWVTNRRTNRYNDNDNNNNGRRIKMLLSFDIHSEKIQFIRLPTECTLVPTDQCVEYEHHLLEFKGYPCVARSEKIMTRSNRYQCSDQRWFYRCKVHMYILKDKLLQVWEKGEIFNTQMEEEGLPPAPFRCYFGTTASPTTTPTAPPTRVLNFSDQVLLYWFDGECLIFYNLQMKYLKVVNCLRSCNKKNCNAFEIKMKVTSLKRNISGNNHIYCPYMDYQLHAQVDNMLSLKTFIPEGGTCTLVGNDGFQKYVENNIPAGWLSTGRVLSRVEYHFF